MRNPRQNRGINIVINEENGLKKDRKKRINKEITGCLMEIVIISIKSRIFEELLGENMMMMMMQIERK